MEEDDEESKTIPKWVELEYKVQCARLQRSYFRVQILIQHMQDLAGQGSNIHFSHVSPSSQKSLERLFETNASQADKHSKASVSAHTISVLELMKAYNVPIERVCLLDPKAPQVLAPEDGQDLFDWFLFGVCSTVSAEERLGPLDKLIRPGIDDRESLVRVSPCFSHQLNSFVRPGDDPPRDRTSELRVLGFPSRHLGPVQMTTDTALGVTKLVVEDKGTFVFIYMSFSVADPPSQYHCHRSNTSYVPVMSFELPFIDGSG